MAVATAAAGLTAASASADATKATKLAVLSAVDATTGLDRPVAGKPFNAVVQSQDDSGAVVAVTRNTTVGLSVATGTGVLTGTTTAVIAKGKSSATVTGAVYSKFENGVVLQASVRSGQPLLPASITINVQAFAAAKAGSPHALLTLALSECSNTTPSQPTCATLLLPNGANGPVLLNEGSCSGILTCRTLGASSTLLVEATAFFKDANGVPLYTRSDPATLIVQCDKSLCGNGGVASFPLSVNITGDGFTTAPACPSKGVISADVTTPPFCMDNIQSHRDNAGDLIAYLLFSYDLRASFP